MASPDRAPSARSAGDAGADHLVALVEHDALARGDPALRLVEHHGAGGHGAGLRAAVRAALGEERALDRAARVYRQPLAGTRWSEVARLSGTDHPLFQLRGTNGRGHKVELEVTAAGRVVEVEEHGIPLREVPDAVTAALKGRRPSFRPTRAEAVYQADREQPVCYGFEGEDVAGKKVEVYISALRRKLRPGLIRTVRGAGYRLEAGR